MRVACYPQDKKRKSFDICVAFATGCGGDVITDGKHRPGRPAMFYGIDNANERVWHAASADLAQDYYYADNAFFDQVRGTYYRVGKNRLQHSGRGTSDGRRFRALNIPIQPWRQDGSFILLTPQSDHFMRVAVGYPGSWVEDTITELRRHTDREIRVRTWNRDKKKLAQELPQAMAGAWAVVTYSSGSAISAILSGIPAISTAECIARRMCGDLSTIESPLMPDNREAWANVVADQQWTLDEMASGETWAALNDVVEPRAALAAMKAAAKPRTELAA